MKTSQNSHSHGKPERSNSPLKLLKITFFVQYFFEKLKDKSLFLIG